MEELDALKKRFNTNSKLAIDNKFQAYSKIYPHTNENLSDYIEDLTNKSVLTVSASGDHVLNIIGRKASKIDTFDINKYSPLYMNLKIYAIKYLEYYDAYRFLSRLNKEIYFKFNTKLPQKERIVFDYLFKKYDVDTIYKKLFETDCSNYVNNNNYFNEEVLRYIKNNIDNIEMKHYCSNIYELPNYLDTTYDRIYLSNISEYQLEVNRFLRYITYLKNYLNDDGKIYYAYLYNTLSKSSSDAIKKINSCFKTNFNPDDYEDIVDNTEVNRIRSAENKHIRDCVLILRK